MSVTRSSAAACSGRRRRSTSTRRGGPHKRWTFWRILRWTLAVVLISGVTIGGAVAYYVWNRLERITTTSDPNLKAADKQLAAVVDPGHAARRRARARIRQALRREGPARPFRHADADARRPAHAQSSRCSRCRATCGVNIDGLGMRKINDAYAYGGAPLAIKTVSQVLGVKINYYVPVNFHLFRKTVDTFHGVYIDVDRRYLHVNNGYGDYSEINLQPGYQKLSGLQALAVRPLPPSRLRLHPHRAPAGVRARVQAPPRRVVGRHEPLRPARLAAQRPQGARLGQGPVGRDRRRSCATSSCSREIKRGNMVQVASSARPGMINGASVVEASPDRRSSDAVNEFQNPNPALSQAVASRFGGTVEGGAKTTAKKTRRAEADPAGQAARRDGQRLRRAGRRHRGARSSSRRRAGRTPASAGNLPRAEPVLDRRSTTRARAPDSRPSGCGGRWATPTPRCACPRR